MDNKIFGGNSLFRGLQMGWMEVWAAGAGAVLGAQGRAGTRIYVEGEQSRTR